MLSDSAKAVYARAIATWAPPPVLSLSQWADQHAFLSPESAAEPGKWHTLPYQRGIMDAITDPSVERITMMKSARVGYTKIVNHAIGYHIHQDPCPILLVQPTIEDAQGYSKDEIAPMVRDTPVLRPLVADARTRDSDNTILKKSFPGGTLIMVGANSPRGFRRISARIVLFDEVDGYPPGGAGSEGDQIMLGIRRSEYYWNRKIVLGSTPTVAGISRIEDSFKSSDQRHYFVPCPFCGHMQVLRWKGIKWPPGEPEKAAYECESCQQLIPHSRKRWMVEHGEWRATKPFNGHAGFHIWAAYSYSPNATWAKLAEEREQVGKDRQKLQTFINTVLGESWEDRGSQPDWTVLKARCEPYQPMTIPHGGYVLTCGVDCHKNRLNVIIRAWGEAEESWLVYAGEIFGDIATDAPWNELDALINRPFRHVSCADLHVVYAAIDSGDFSQIVYNFSRTRAPRVFPVKGQSQANKPILGRPTNQDINYNGRIIKNGIQLWPVGSSNAKTTIYSRLQLTEGPGSYHWYIGASDDYFEQLTGEKQITTYSNGYPVQVWKMIRDNHFLDCEVYAYAAAIRAGVQRIDFNSIQLPQRQPEQVQNSHNKKRPVPTVARSKWMSR
ncbi:phage terminase large subunit family protein [Desulfosarcina ovata]|uniref:Terminase n=1 Tax=Desulfosarcina ovata subsp. ovata TaxID=2752305 RepID=A0A5K8AHA3_9BACT|nr:phage terminase large subunit family protein [Desulfosarcina ovata]BBO92062.1 terminase [Desulfosarcina ovata subsp. ovata]